MTDALLFNHPVRLTLEVPKPIANNECESSCAELSAMPEEKQTQAPGQLASVRDRLDGPITSRPDNMWGRYWMSNPVCLGILNTLMGTFQLWKECRLEEHLVIFCM